MSVVFERVYKSFKIFYDKYYTFSYINNQAWFYVFRCTTNYALASPINRLMSIANQLKIDLSNFNFIESFNIYVNIIFVLKYVIVLSYYYKLL